jgi:hypothetical protein
MQVVNQRGILSAREQGRRGSESSKGYKYIIKYTVIQVVPKIYIRAIVSNAKSV